MVADNPFIQVQHRLVHSRGSRVAGTGGRLYHVDDKGLLHLVVGGIVSPQPGCHPECAARFAMFPDTFRRKSMPPAPIPAPAPSPAPLVEAAGDEPATLSAPDLTVLDGTVSALRTALATGEHDEHLEALLAAEESGKTRKSAVAAINERIEVLED